MASALDRAPWRNAPERREASDSDVRRAIIAALEVHPGAALDDFVFLLDMPDTRPAKERVTRLLVGLLEAKEIERWLDHNERPSQWRYWLRDGCPPIPGPREPLRPKPAAPASVQQIVEDIPPAPATFRPSDVRGGAPPAKATDSPVEVSQVKLNPPARRTPLKERIVEFINQHPAGVEFADVARAFPGENISGKLSEISTEGMVRRTGARKHYRYLPKGAVGAPPAAPPTPKADAPPSPSASAAAPKPKKRGPTPRPRPASGALENVTMRVRELLKAAGDAGLSTRDLGDKAGRSGLTIAAQLAKAGEARRDGYGRGARYFHVRDPILKKGGPKKPTAPLALDVDALEKAVRRVKNAQRELADSQEDLQRLARGEA